MKNYLAKELERYYRFEKGRVIFRNGMSQEKLSGEMWMWLDSRGFGGAGIEPSVLSRVRASERLFTFKQLAAFVAVIGLSRSEQIDLEQALKEDYSERLGLHFESTKSVRDEDDVYRNPPDVIRGRSEVFEAAIQLIEQTSQQTAPQAGQILSTVDILDIPASLRARWWRALRTALDHEWNLIQWVRVASDPHRLLSVVAGTFRFLGAAGRYIPYYVRQSADDSPICDLLIVPQVGALQLMPTRQEGQIDRAFRFSDTSLISSLSDRFALLVQSSTPIFTCYAQHLPPDDETLSSVEGQRGNRYVMKYGMSVLPAPQWLDIERARPFLAKGGAITRLLWRLLEHRKMRRQKFQVQLEQQQQFWDICPESAIVDLLKYGRPAKDDDLTNLLGQTYTRPQAVAHLRAVIELLKKDNYKLGLLDKTNEHLADTFVEIKGEHAVLLQRRHLNRRGQPEIQGLQTTERGFVNAFIASFESIWKKCKFSDNGAVIGRLETLIATA